jgi:benzoylformate decarboxylase
MSPVSCTAIETTNFVGMDFANPDLDMQRIAEGFGARSEKIESARTIGEVLDVRSRIRGRPS